MPTSKTFWILSVVAVAIGSVLFFLLPLVIAKNSFNAAETLERILTGDAKSDFLVLEGKIKEIMRQHGLEAGFLIVKEADEQHRITNDQCHSLLHYVGHEAYAQFGDDFDRVTSVVGGTRCIGGYIHGVEAEIVLGGDDVRNTLWELCQYTNANRITPGSCYHGAGHAAMENFNHESALALEFCNTLSGGPEKDLTNCYRGVFSELHYALLGIDGHTGLSAERIEKEEIDIKNPYLYCQKMEKKYQTSCKSQLTGLATENMPLPQRLDTCLNPEYDRETQEICVNISAGVFVRESMSFATSTKLPDIVNRMSENLKRVAVLGSAEAFSGYFADDKDRDFHSFCNDSFTKLTDVDYCLGIMEETKNGNSPWMDLSHIR